MVIICPVCGKDDAYQKVTDIASSGQYKDIGPISIGGIAYSGGENGLEGAYSYIRMNQEIELAQRLACPVLVERKPKYNARYAVIFGSFLSLTIGESFLETSIQPIQQVRAMIILDQPSGIT